MTTKDFKTIEEQIELLKSRGLTIHNDIQTKEFLLKHNYYRISGYSLTLRSHDVFNKNASFQNIVDIYCFDHDFRHILLKYIDTIEVTIKSIFAYEFSKKYGPFGYLNEAYFTDVDKHKEIIKKVEEQKKARLPHEAYLKHFIEELKQEVPLWACVDLFTISDISFFYKIASKDIQDSVALAMGINHNGAELLTRFMHSITIIRNLCAHGSRLYNRLFEQKPWLSKHELRLLLKNSDGSVDNSHVFSFILVMRRLLKIDEFNCLITEINNLSKKYPFVDLRYYGFPKNFNNIK